MEQYVLHTWYLPQNKMVPNKVISHFCQKVVCYLASVKLGKFEIKEIQKLMQKRIHTKYTR